MSNVLTVTFSILEARRRSTSRPEDNSINGLITLVENRIVPGTDYRIGRRMRIIMGGLEYEEEVVAL